jgi:hypothetical protein
MATAAIFACSGGEFMKPIKLFCLIGLSIIFFSSAALAGKKSIVLGDTKTKWASSSACTGYAPSYADTIAKSLLAKIAESKSFSVISRDKFKTSKQADYVLTVQVLCHTNSVELVVMLVDVETAEIAWSKMSEFDNVRKIKSGLGEIVRLLSAYAKSGKLPRDVENPATKNSPLNGQTLVLFPIQASPGKFKDKTLENLTGHLKRKLTHVAGAKVIPIGETKSAMHDLKIEKCTDKACHIEVAEALGTERAMAVEIVSVGEECAISFALYNTDKSSIVKSASTRTACFVKDIRSGLDKIVALVSRK